MFESSVVGLDRSFAGFPSTVRVLEKMKLFRKLLNMIGNLFAESPKAASKRSLLSMYFGESNSGGRRKSNRDRA